MAAISGLPPIVAQKLEVFEQLQDEFESSFRYVQAMHGQQRFKEVPLSNTIRYLHALWVCECKDRLLSIPKTIKRYEGLLCLELLRGWQEDVQGTASVVAFLHRKLDMMPFADLTRQIYIARRDTQDESLAKRLTYGRGVLLNRGMNLMAALDAIFALPEEGLSEMVRDSCQKLGHTPEQISHQISLMKTPLYAYVPHQMLAKTNMRLMNRLGIEVLPESTERPEKHSGIVAKGKAPYAVTVISGYQELSSSALITWRPGRSVEER